LTHCLSAKMIIWARFGERSAFMAVIHLRRRVPLTARYYAAFERSHESVS